MNARMEGLGITPQVLLDVFDTPVSFHRCLVPVTGGVTSVHPLPGTVDAGDRAVALGAGNRAARLAPLGTARRASRGHAGQALVPRASRRRLACFAGPCGGVVPMTAGRSRRG
jgi:hypothetical protein